MIIEREKLIALVQGLQNGEDQAATELFETLHSDIYYFILKTVDNDRDLAEDLTQDTFVEILDKINTLQEPAAFISWSKQIAYHKCTDYFKKKKELLVDEQEDGYTIFDTVEEDRAEFIPGAALDKEDLRHTIISMIDELPAEQKSALILRYFNEVSVKEIADIQGVTEGTVKSRLNYGRKAIKQSVEAYEKKHNVKLHCAGVTPLLLWLFKEYRIGKGLSVSSGTAAQAFVITEEASTAAVAAGSSASASIGSTVATSTTTATTATATTAATTATTATAAKAAVGIGAKIVGSTLATKIVAGVVAVSIAVGGVYMGLSAVDTTIDAEPTYISNTEETVSHTSEVPTASISEETTIPTTEVVTEETTVATTEPSSIETEATTEIVCYHEQTYQSPYPDGTRYAILCSYCGIILQDNLYYEPEGDAPNPDPTEVLTCQEGGEHSWAVEQTVNYHTIVEKTYCKCCGEYTEVEYENPCNHDTSELVEIIEDEYGTIGRFICTSCGAESYGAYGVGDTEPFTCEHEWQYQTTESEKYIHEERICYKCGYAEVVSSTEKTSPT